jgi:hypothetical protein
MRITESASAWSMSAQGRLRASARILLYSGKNNSDSGTKSGNVGIEPSRRAIIRQSNQLLLPF